MSRNILLADDSLTIQKVVELTFMEGDFEVTAVSNGDDALSKLEEMTPDIVIADVHMPGADGYRICQAAKEKFPDVPVLLLVGTFEPFEEGAASECGANAHLKKPFDSQELLRLVEDLLRAGSAEELDHGPALEEPTAEVAGEAGFAVEGPDETTEAAAELLDEGAEFAPSVSPAVEPAFQETSRPVAGPEEAAADSATAGLSEQDIDRIARRVVKLLSDQVVREISWDVIPDLAEIVIKDRIRELESQVE